MAFELTDDYFITSDGNAMSVDERIKNAFAVDGKVSYKSVVYNSEVELRDKLIQEGVLKKENLTDIVKQTASKLKGLFFIFGICLLLFACGSGLQNNSKKEDNSPPQGDIVDKTVIDFKHWNYCKIGNQLTATLYSQNYYMTNRNENLYGGINFYNDGSDGCYLSFFVQGGDAHVPNTIMTFSRTETYFIVSFDGGDLMMWPGSPSLTGKIFTVGNYADWLNAIKKSNSCLISILTSEGQIKYVFDTKGLKWE